MISEDDITTQLLVDTVHDMYFRKQSFIDAMGRSHQRDSIQTILNLIEETVAKAEEEEKEESEE